MPQADFEEKEFEFPLYRELLASEFDVWTPGQVLEGHLGFDGALRVAKDYWDVVGRDAAPGVTLARYGLSPMLARPGDLPDFSTNLFLQVKRPYEYVDPPAEVKAKGLRSPSWYFTTRDHQQPLLERLATHLGAQAEVAYASPAFAQRARLFAVMRARELRKHTTFPAAAWLAGHGAWHYDRGGASGVAMSDPERVDGPELPSRLDRIRQAGAGTVRWHEEEGLKPQEAVVPREQEERITRHLSALLADVQRGIEEVGGDEGTAITTRVELALRRVSGQRRECQRLVLKMALTATYLGSSWLVIGAREMK